jgi:hypothetical protein
LAMACVTAKRHIADGVAVVGDNVVIVHGVYPLALAIAAALSRARIYTSPPSLPYT